MKLIKHLVTIKAHNMTQTIPVNTKYPLNDITAKWYINKKYGNSAELISVKTK